MKTGLILLVLCCCAYSIFAQNPESLKILPFDEEKYNQLFDEDDLLFPDSVLSPVDSLSSELIQPNDIYVIPVPEKEMAQMPNMPFKKDVHYTMQIKWYDLQYPYERKDPPDTAKSSDGLFKPLYIPKNRK